MKRMRKGIALLSTVAMCGAMIAGCGETVKDESTPLASTAEVEGDFDGTISIAGIAPLTGSFASWGKGAINGYNLAIKQINEAGGVKLDGKSYKLESAVFADDKSDATEAASAYNNCASYDISAVIGSCSSSCTMSFIESAQDSGMLVITPYSTNAAICKTGDYIFRECFSDANQGPTLAKLATEEFKAKNVAIVVAEDSDYCAGLAEQMEGYLDTLGDVTYEHYGCVETDTDYTAQISKAIEQGAEAIIYPNNYDTVPNFIQQARDAGFDGPIMGGDAWDGTDTAGYEDKFANTYYLAHVDLSADTDEVKNFVSDYKAEYGSEDGLNAVASLYYDSVKMLVKAMEEAGSDDPSVVKDALLKISYDSMGGTITYDENGDAVKPFTIETFDNGALTYYGSF
ncbi:ABC transporter substrate-binding protein [Butyrivibrio sp. JL13D10]|uniref:ABC transporter substrate-binding protein n=1 Tax=Butyrivibrio sp. JL13D10 TaxID=3236815 RepID=UPI0038B4910B